MDDLAGPDRALDGVEELDELLVGVARHAAADHGAVEDVEGGEQGGRAVTLVVVGHGAAFAGLHGQAGLGAVERLDLRFLVDRDDDGMDGRVHVEADDIFDLFSEGRVGGRLEGADPVGLKTVRLPDALHGAQADACRLGDHAARPMSGLSGRLAARQRQDFGHGRRRQRLLAGLARLIAQQPVDTLLGEALLPSPYRRSAGVGLARHRQHRQAVGRQENDPSPLNVFLRPVAIADDRSQSHTIFVAKKNTDGLCHAPRIAWLEPAVNPMFVSMH